GSEGFAPIVRTNDGTQTGLAKLTYLSDDPGHLQIEVPLAALDNDDGVLNYADLAVDIDVGVSDFVLGAQEDSANAVPAPPTGVLAGLSLLLIAGHRLRSWGKRAKKESCPSC